MEYLLFIGIEGSNDDINLPVWLGTRGGFVDGGFGVVESEEVEARDSLGTLESFILFNSGGYCIIKW